MEMHTHEGQNDILNLFNKNIEAGSTELLKRLPKILEPLATNRNNLLELLLTNLDVQLLKISEWTLLAHYMVAESDIQARNVAQKMDIFCKSLLEDDVKKYFSSSFPILFEYIRNETDQWVNHSLLLVNRYLHDYDIILHKFFNGVNPGNICKIEFGLGDKHNQGESVTLFLFESGKKLIYIPRKRNFHTHFSDICNWLDGSLNIGFKHPVNLLMDSHTWVEFIENTSCTKSDQLHKYYERTGVYLALLYAMDATDFHYENIIACGEYPVLIDMESFFHPFMPFEGKENHIGFNNSVLKSGLLPAVHSFDGKNILDVSGLSNANGSLELNKSLQFILDENGKMKTQRKKGRLSGGKNIPLLFDKPVEISCNYSEDLKRGFLRAYNLIKNNKQEFLEHLDCFKNDEIRVIFRNTAAYSHLLKEGKHPDLLRNRERTELHLNWLNFIQKEYPVIDVFSNAEKDDLFRQNIPYFYTNADSRDIWHNGKLLRNDFFNKSGYETAKEKINLLSDDDLERQCWIIDMSLAIRETEKKPVNGFLAQNKIIDNAKIIYSSIPGIASTKQGDDFDKNRFLDAGIKLSDELTKNMKITEKDAYWLVLKPMNLDSSHYEITPASYDLYSGMPGEIICLTYLGMLTGESKYTEIAYKALNHLVKKVDGSVSSIRNTGIFGGWGSLIYLMAILSKIREKNIWTDLALSWIKKIKPCELSVQEANHGLVSGTAGFIIACLAAYKVSKEDEFLRMADKMSGVLLRSAFQTDDQLKWKGYSKQPLAGLSHGASGYALCFARLYHYTGTRRYKEIVKKILNYETHLYDPKQKNWPDLRDFVLEQNNGNTYFSTAWSHGAPGIGIARLEILKQGIKNRNIIKDLDISIDTCIKNGFGGGHNLCFGDFGNLELLINASIFFKNDKLRETYRHIATEVLHEGMTNGFRLTRAKKYTPGLMNGITGVIYQCLRVYDPECVPSLLSLSI